MRGPEAKKWVSIWVGFVEPGRDVDVLKELCGVKHYDPDFQDIVFGERRRHRPIKSLLRRLSYAKSFLVEASEGANEKGITDALYVLAQYGLRCSPKRVTKAKPAPMFLGCFAWNDLEDADFMNECLAAIRKADQAEGQAPVASRNKLRRKS